MREGALDFLVKPIDEPALLEALGRAREKALAQQVAARRERDAADRLARLTRRHAR